MTRTTRDAVCIAALAAALGFAALWCRGYGVRADARLEHARADAARASRLADEILMLRGPGAPVPAGGLAGEKIVGVVEAGARRAGIPTQNIARVWPGPPRRSGGGETLEHPTEVLMLGLSLGSAVSFLLAVCAEAPALEVRAVRLTAHGPDRTFGVWTLEATFVHQEFSPRRRSPADQRDAG